MKRKGIEAKGTPMGPYSLAVDAAGFVYVSGQAGVDPDTKRLAPGGIGPETRQTFANIFRILAAAGLSSDDVQKVNVYLTDIDNFAEMNAVYKEQFTEPYPARTTVAVKALPRTDALVEIEVVAKR
ncbi:MAG: Rid family detoxifying hydrolase [Fusobacteriaceae bacterium]|jgi:2-iminobutanoate/2-iminopropanoate deaminase|nr:Rid family detoxifying hydrolase [Fusobacteriaceae bacterium]